MLFDNLLGDGQPQPCAMLFARVEWLEDLLQSVRGDALACIFHMHPHAFRLVGAFGYHAHRAAAGGGLLRR
jgi:hypothetical protein